MQGRYGAVRGTGFGVDDTVNNSIFVGGVSDRFAYAVTFSVVEVGIGLSRLGVGSKLSAILPSKGRTASPIQRVTNGIIGNLRPVDLGQQIAPVGSSSVYHIPQRLSSENDKN